MKRSALLLVCNWLVSSCIAVSAQSPPAKSVESVSAAYVNAVGGQAAVDSITTREVRGNVHRGPKATYYWQKPNKILLLSGKSKTGYDGGSGWEYSKKKKLNHLPLGAHLALEMNANPLRYVYLRSLYPNGVSLGPKEMLDGKPMDVLVAPNKLGATKLYFDAQSHLLRRVEESGEASAYFKNTTEFMDYKKAGNVLFPFRIVHSTTAPDSHKEDFHVNQVTNNIPIKPEVFDKPQGAAVTFGGKR
jgi:hypothetical protein